MKYIAKMLVTSFIVGTASTGGANLAIAAEPIKHKTTDVRTDTKPSDVREKQTKLAEAWVDLWNGNYALSKGIVSPDVRVHAALMDGGDGSAVKGPAGMVALITQIHSAFSDLNFRVDVGPIIDGEHVVIRWIATGTYSGGFPGATAAVGTKITFTGADMLRVKSGLIIDYWLNADTLLLVNQLKVVAAK